MLWPELFHFRHTNPFAFAANLHVLADFFTKLRGPFDGFQREHWVGGVVRVEDDVSGAEPAIPKRLQKAGIVHAIKLQFIGPFRKDTPSDADALGRDLINSASILDPLPYPDEKRNHEPNEQETQHVSAEIDHL